MSYCVYTMTCVTLCPHLGALPCECDTFSHVLPEEVARRKQLEVRVWTVSSRGGGLMIQAWSRLRWYHDMMNLQTKNFTLIHVIPAHIAATCTQMRCLHICNTQCRKKWSHVWFFCLDNKAFSHASTHQEILYHTCVEDKWHVHHDKQIGSSFFPFTRICRNLCGSRLFKDRSTCLLQAFCHMTAILLEYQHGAQFESTDDRKTSCSWHGTRHKRILCNRSTKSSFLNRKYAYEFIFLLSQSYVQKAVWRWD